MILGLHIKNDLQLNEYSKTPHFSRVIILN